MTNREREDRQPRNPFFEEVYYTLSNPEQGDYEGFSDLARKYRTKKERHDPTLPQFISAIGMVIEMDDISQPGVNADAVHLAYHLNLWELEENVARLKASPLYETVEYIKHEVDNFSAYKKQEEFNNLPSEIQKSFDSFYTRPEELQ